MRSSPFSVRGIALAGALVVALQLASPVAALATTASTLTLTAKPSKATIGDKIDLSGMLMCDDSAASVGQTITLTRDPAGSDPLPDVVTVSDGSFSATDTADVAGVVTYQASFAGTPECDPANATDTVSVAKLPSHVSLTVSAHAVTFGTAVHLTGHLGRGTDSSVLGIYAKPEGGNEKLIREAKVGRHRDFHASYTPSKDTTFIARYAGDLTHHAAHDDAATRVRVIVRAQLTKAVARAGRYHIYRRGTHAPCLVQVVPNHKGFAVRATLQMFAHGAWRRSAARSFRLNTASAVGFAVRGSANVDFRVHVSLSTHHDHLGDTSPWLYLRFR